jgi:hypothetical protein
MPSAAIRSFAYDPASETLTVTFVTGRRYAYAAVPPQVAAAFAGAFSKGQFFNAAIRNRYAYRRLPADRSERAA